mgnify:CR=1 FL=1
MRTIPKYCFIEIPGAVYIIHTEHPYIIGRVWMYKDWKELYDQLEKLNPLAKAKMDTHNIAVTVWTILKGMPMQRDIKKEAQEIVDAMLEFFVQSRVTKSPKFYNKFLM